MYRASRSSSNRYNSIACAMTKGGRKYRVFGIYSDGFAGIHRYSQGIRKVFARYSRGIREYSQLFASYSRAIQKIFALIRIISHTFTLFARYSRSIRAFTGIHTIRVRYSRVFARYLRGIRAVFARYREVFTAIHSIHRYSQVFAVFVSRSQTIHIHSHL